MTLNAVLTILTILVVLALLMRGRLGADAILVGALGFLVVAGVVPAKEGLAGFANEGMLTVAALYVVAAGLRQTGAMTRVASGLLGRKPDVRVAMTRMVVPVALGSAVLNNTPIVAAMLPAVVDWSRRYKLPASKLLMPLSFATILGGTLTVIGTSTNLVVTGLVERNLGHVEGLKRIGIFDISGVGLGVAVAGLLLLVLLGPVLIPDRSPAVSLHDDPREYTTELLVSKGSPMAGRTVEEAGLRNLSGGFLMEIDRGATVLPVVEPTTRLIAGDRLVFVGPREAVLDLTRLPGLQAAPDQRFRLDSPDGERCLVEAVVAPGNPLRGKAIRDGRFRDHFNAVVVAVARDGRRIGGRLGDVVLEAGDVLLLEAHPSWSEAQHGGRDFYLTSEVADSSAFRPGKAGVAALVMLVMVVAAATEVVSMFHAAIVAAFAMIWLGACSPADARKSIDIGTLVAIAASFGIGESIRMSGTDQLLAEALVSAGASSPMMALAAMYVGTMILTELITNNAAAALMFPFGLSLAAQLGVSPMPFCVAVMFAASASFSTPIGYQTNLMVYGPGGYRFGDYFRLGVPLQLVAGLVAWALIPHFFPF